MIRKIELLVDDLDFDAIQKEFALRQRTKRGLPDSEDGANIAGCMIGEMVRDLQEYRALWIAEHTEP